MEQLIRFAENGNRAGPYQGMKIKWLSCERVRENERERERTGSLGLFNGTEAVFWGREVKMRFEVFVFRSSRIGKEVTRGTEIIRLF